MSDKHLTPRLCDFPGCTNKHDAKGLCSGHRRQMLKGLPLSQLQFQRRHGEPPIITYVEQPCSEWGVSQGLTTPCHIFDNGTSSQGYGRIAINRKAIYVHRYVWERDIGPIPDGMSIDHICRVRNCCNVNHLRVVTHQVNMTENIVGSCWQKNAAKTHCPKGHPYDETNTIIVRTKSGNGRKCRTCDNARRRRPA